MSDNDNVDASVIFVNLAHLSLRNGDINDDNMEIAAAIMWASRDTECHQCTDRNSHRGMSGLQPGGYKNWHRTYQISQPLNGSYLLSACSFT